MSPRTKRLVLVGLFGWIGVSLLSGVVQTLVAGPPEWDDDQVVLGGRVEADDDLVPGGAFPDALHQVYSFEIAHARNDPQRLRLWAKLPLAVVTSPPTALHDLACRFGREAARRPRYAGTTRVVLHREKPAGLADPPGELPETEVVLAECG